jgi:formiminotetrahydrofolate cyclodeaminase
VNPAPFRDHSIAAFVDRLSSAEPVPGGGSASAIAASLAASLVAMVAALSEGRPKYAQHATLHARAGASARGLADRLLGLADDDAAAYAGFAAALKLPRETDPERALRTSAIQAAARIAAEIPLQCVEACLEVVQLAEALAGRSNVNASSDLNVASLLAEAGGRGAAANVLVNLPSVGDEVWATEMSSRVEELLRELTRVAAATREVVQGGEARAPVESPAPA